MFGLGRILTKERITFLLVFAAMLQAQLSVILDYFPDDSSLARTVTMGVSLLGQVAALLKFLDGSNNWDSLQVAGIPKGAKVVNITAAPSHITSNFTNRPPDAPLDESEIEATPKEHEDLLDDERKSGFGG